MLINGISGNSTGTRTILVSPSDKLVFSYSKDSSSASGSDQAQFSYTITDVACSYLDNYFEEDSTNSIVPTTLEDVTITNCESLSSSFLSGISSIKNISLPDTITIESEAFAGCVNLQTISLSNELTKIGDSAFNNCSNLTEIFIPASVTEIGSNAFKGCTNLTINCEVTSIPTNWNINWNPDNCNVVWGYTDN